MKNLNSLYSLVTKISVGVGLLLIFGATSAKAAVYYVSPSGSDTNSGSTTAPFKTILYSSNKMTAGDVLYLRAGVYSERPIITVSGTSALPIIIRAYPNESVIIDGTGLGGKPYGALVKITGNYIKFSDVEIRNSEGMGLYISGSYDIISRVHSHHHWENGILVAEGSVYSVVEDSIVNDNIQSNLNGLALDGGYWGSGLTAARNPNNIIFRRNQVYNNWGEGLSTYEANHITMEDNVVYNNYSANVYLSDVQYALLQRNLVYETPDSPVNSGSRVGIMLGDEKQTYGPSSNNTIVNNLVYGSYRNFYKWSNPIFTTDGLINTVVANNTFVNSVGTAGVQINAGAHSNSFFENNVILQENSLPSGLLLSTSGITYDHNLWSNAPNANTNTTDIIANPSLTKTGSTGAGQLTGDWFKLSSTSLAINHGASLAQTALDYFGNTRDAQPDMGGVEYIVSTPTSTSPTPLLTSTPLPTSLLSASPALTPSVATETWFEAEAGIITSPFTVTAGSISQTINNSDIPSAGGKAVYTVQIPQTGNYVVKGMVNAPGDPNNSFYVNFDTELASGTSWIWDILPYTTGTEMRTVSWRGNGTYSQNQYNPMLFPLTAGQHSLIIRGREPGVSIDKLMVSRVYKPGDANGDEIVDGSDYAIWLNNYGIASASGNPQGDFNGDTKVDDLDYSIWLKNYQL